VLGEPVSELDGLQSGIGPVLVINDGDPCNSLVAEL
jgi:hypothetical protein